MTLVAIDQQVNDILPEEFDRRIAHAQAKAQSLARIVEAQKWMKEASL